MRQRWRQSKGRCWRSRIWTRRTRWSIPGKMRVLIPHNNFKRFFSWTNMQIMFVENLFVVVEIFQIDQCLYGYIWSACSSPVEKYWVDLKHEVEKFHSCFFVEWRESSNWLIVLWISLICRNLGSFENLLPKIVMRYGLDQSQKRNLTKTWQNFLSSVANILQRMSKRSHTNTRQIKLAEQDVEARQRV